MARLHQRQAVLPRRYPRPRRRQRKTDHGPFREQDAQDKRGPNGTDQASLVPQDPGERGNNHRTRKPEARGPSAWDYGPNLQPPLQPTDARGPNGPPRFAPRLRARRRPPYAPRAHVPSQAAAPVRLRGGMTWRNQSRLDTSKASLRPSRRLQRSSARRTGPAQRKPAGGSRKASRHSFGNSRARLRPA